MNADACATPNCGHESTDHSTLVGCLEDGCACERFTSPAPRHATLQEGRDRRDAGLAVVGTTAPGPLVTSWRAEAATALDALITGGQVFDADDLVDMVGMPPRPNMVGAVFMAASRQKRIVPVGYTQATRAASHARVQRTWKAA